MVNLSFRRAQFWPKTFERDDSASLESSIDALCPWQRYGKKEVEMPDTYLDAVPLELQKVCSVSWLRFLPWIIGVSVVFIVALLLFIPSALGLKTTEEYLMIPVGVIFVSCFILPIIFQEMYRKTFIKRKNALDGYLMREFGSEVLRAHFLSSEVYVHPNREPRNDSLDFLQFLMRNRESTGVKNLQKSTQEVLGFKGTLRCGAHFEYRDLRCSWVRSSNNKEIAVDAVKAFIFTLNENVEDFIIDMPASEAVINLHAPCTAVNAIMGFIPGMQELWRIQNTYYDIVPLMRICANEPYLNFDMLHGYARLDRYVLFMQKLLKNQQMVIHDARVKNKSNILCDIRGGYGVPNASFQACLKQIRDKSGTYCSVLGYRNQLIVLLHDPSYLFLSDMAVDWCLSNAPGAFGAKMLMRRWNAQAEWINDMFSPLYEHGLVR